MGKNVAIVVGILLILGMVSSFLVAREPVSEERVFDVERVSMIDINTDNVAVNIYPSTDPSIKVTLEGETSGNIQSFSTEVDDSTLYITYHDRQRGWLIFDLLNGINRLTINLYLPEKQYDALNVSNRNGRVSVEQLNAKQVALKTKNGRIHLQEVLGDNIQVETRNGKITLDHVEGDIEGETRNGKISLATQDLDRNIQLKTRNGKITIATEQEPTNVQFNVSVKNGKVNILDQYQGSATIGNGDHLIELTTYNGKITVTTLN